MVPPFHHCSSSIAQKRGQGTNKGSHMPTLLFAVRVANTNSATTMAGRAITPSCR